MGNGAHKIPKCILELPVNMGGIAYPNVERIFQSIRLSWTRELFSEDVGCPWKETACMILSLFKDYRGLSRDIFKLALFKNRITSCGLPAFYRACLKDWVYLGGAEKRPEPYKFADFLGEPIFKNPFVIAKGDKPLAYPDWLKRQTSPFATVRDLAYGVGPGFMPPEAIIEEHALVRVSHTRIQNVLNSLSTKVRNYH